MNARMCVHTSMHLSTSLSLNAEEYRRTMEKKSDPDEDWSGPLLPSPLSWLPIESDMTTKPSRLGLTRAFGLRSRKTTPPTLTKAIVLCGLSSNLHQLPPSFLAALRSYLSHRQNCAVGGPDAECEVSARKAVPARSGSRFERPFRGCFAGSDRRILMRSRRVFTQPQTSHFSGQTRPA